MRKKSSNHILISRIQSDIDHISEYKKYFHASQSHDELTSVRNTLLGRGGRLSVIMRMIGKLNASNRRLFGQKINDLKSEIESSYVYFNDLLKDMPKKDSDDDFDSALKELFSDTVLKELFSDTTERVDDSVDDIASYTSLDAKSDTTNVVDKVYERAYSNMRKKWITAELELRRAAVVMCGHLNDQGARTFVCAYTERLLKDSIGFRETSMSADVVHRFRRHSSSTISNAIACANSLSQDSLYSGHEDLDSALIDSFNEVYGSPDKTGHVVRKFDTGQVNLKTSNQSVTS